ncbi:MAG: hypothetical protein LBT46_09305 [Planctomycetaceae bacterium]|jgi:hypothetical protein|nr:hypothetical protein [Planctomycetaceae bacterium]
MITRSAVLDFGTDRKVFPSVLPAVGMNGRAGQDSSLNNIRTSLKEFANGFCREDGGIDWDKLVQFNSGKNTPK